MVLEGLGICLDFSADPWICCDVALWGVVLALAYVTLHDVSGLRYSGNEAGFGFTVLHLHPEPPAWPVHLRFNLEMWHR